MYFYVVPNVIFTIYVFMLYVSNKDMKRKLWLSGVPGFLDHKKARPIEGSNSHEVRTCIHASHSFKLDNVFSIIGPSLFWMMASLSKLIDI